MKATPLFGAALFALLATTVVGRAEGPAKAPEARRREEKLDRILNKLDDLDRRLKKLEAKPAAAETTGTGWQEILRALREQLFADFDSDDANRRMRELLNTSNDLRDIEREWESIWFTDQPSHLTPERVHGGIQ